MAHARARSWLEAGLPLALTQVFRKMVGTRPESAVLSLDPGFGAHKRSVPPRP